VEVEEPAKALEQIVINAAEIFLQYKLKSAIMHDAFCLQLQQAKNSLFATNDRSLFYVSKILIENGKISKPLSVELSVWLSALTFIRPPANERTSIEAFKEFVATPLSSKLRPISMNKLISVAFPWLKEEYLSPADLEDIMSRKFIEDYIIKPQEEKIAPIITAEEIIPEIIDKKIKEKIGNLEKEKAQLVLDKARVIKEKQEVETKYQKAVASPIKIKPLFFIGVASLIILVVFVILSAFLKISIPDVAYYSFTIIAIIFIGASIFGESALKIFKWK
jgi:hypothetical protein